MKSSRRSWLFAIAIGVTITAVTAIADYTCSSGGTDQHDMDGPKISPCKNEIILQNGQNFTLKCKGKKQVQIKRQDSPEEGLGMFYTEGRNLTSLDIDNPFEVALDLYNVDQYAVGYYACFDDKVDSNTVLNDLMDEPNNTEHVTYTYIYVNGTDVLFAPLSEYFIMLNGSKTILRCRPTMPDTEMTLSVVGVTLHLIDYDYEKYDPKIGITLCKDDLPEDVVFFECDTWRRYDSARDVKQFIVKQEVKWTPNINIHGGFRHFLAGENFTLNCSVKYQPNSAIALSWDIPKALSKETVVNVTNECNVSPGEKLFNAIIIVNATQEAEGNYTCVLNSGPKTKKYKMVQKDFIDKPFIDLKKGNDDEKIETAARSRTISLNVEVKAYPPPKFSCYRDNKELPRNSTKYKAKIEELTGDFVLTITNLTIEDTANYTVMADNGYITKNVTFDVRKKAKPIILFGPEKDIIYLENTTQTLLCEAFGYPAPNIVWTFSSNDETIIENGEATKESEYKVTSKLNIIATSSGNVTCNASNIIGTSFKTRQLLIHEIINGFGILDTQEWFPENHNILLRCLASKYKFENSTWLGPDGKELKELVKYSQTSFSHVAKLKIDHVSLSQNGTYTCVGRYSDGSEIYQTTSIVIEAVRDPIISEPKIDRDEEVTKYQPVAFSCVADAVPAPIIEWFKDGLLLENNTNGLVMYNHFNHTVINSTITIKSMREENKGKYECMATSDGISKSKFVNLIMKDTSPFTTGLLSVIGAVVLVLVILVIYLAWKIRKEKRFRKELAAAGLLYFKEGVTKSLNPDLGIDEQAELLPYDERFEFPPDRLILGKQLGAGAFGVVYKAEARGIINAEETTPVAVKMVKKTADNMYIKALASELKIMVHLGKHINIVNLLGACTKNVGKRELIVIVEYCKFGNIHNYIQKHREVFIDQLTDNKEKNLGKVNRGYSCSSASSGANSDYFGTNHTQATDHTFVNTANTNRSGRKDKQNQQEEFVKVSETGYVQPEWRSNYETDYSFDGRNPRPLCSRDLLAWAFQIARGMEYLASRKVLHGDLAARNVLLAEDNIVKICDFGLARSIYKNDEYQKKENSPLPVKWLAIECMTDRIFSTQSDVWSFGIVLWEMFSLAKTPYPNMSPQNLLQWLSDGHRLEKPTYADDRLYDVMKRCWEYKPPARPTFSQLQELLGTFLEANVRNHYVDLNSPYMALNAKSEGQEDYLTMVSAPDYKNLVTPSPHHYMNDVTSFFPPTPNQLPLDDEGYLQMTPANQIFSPRSQSTKFDFDARKLDPRDSDAQGGSELTPMLTLNNLPARSGSDSDHEGGHSPYLKMCPRIVEETDDVFKPSSNNFKNIQNSAVSNPTYITFDVDIEKKPQDINTYVNISNGLVK